MYFFNYPSVSYREITAYSESHTDSVQYYNEVDYHSGY
jgi:hypothetical protein